MKIRKYLILLCVVAMLSILVFGCQKKNKLSTKATTTTKATTEAKEEPKNSRAKKVVDEAIAIYKEKPEYSMEKRMEEGYIDCSVYVWKCYRTIGISFGDESYAPTAADIASWCNDMGKLVSLKPLKNKKKKLEPGDLIFYKKPTGSNGRYKNISHVGIYIGNGRMLHADGTSPAYGNPWYRTVVAVARPTMK